MPQQRSRRDIRRRQQRQKKVERAVQYGEQTTPQQRARALDVAREGPTTVTVKAPGEPTRVITTTPSGRVAQLTQVQMAARAKETQRIAKLQEQKETIRKQELQQREIIARQQLKARPVEEVKRKLEATKIPIEDREARIQKTREAMGMPTPRGRLRIKPGEPGARPEGRLRIAPGAPGGPPPKEELAYKKELGWGFSIAVPKKTEDIYAKKETRILEKAPKGAITKYEPVFRAEGFGELAKIKEEEAKAIPGKGVIPRVRRLALGVEAETLKFAEFGVKHPVITGATIIGLPYARGAVGKVVGMVGKKVVSPVVAGVAGQVARKTTGVAITSYFAYGGAKTYKEAVEAGAPKEFAVGAALPWVTPIAYEKIAGRVIARRQLKAIIPAKKMALAERVKPVTPKELPISQVAAFKTRPKAIEPTAKFLRRPKVTELLIGEKPKLVVGGTAAQVTQARLGRALGDIDIYAGLPGLRAKQLGKRLTKAGVKGVKVTYKKPGEIMETGQVFVRAPKVKPGVKMIGGKPYEHMVSFHTKEYRRTFPFKFPTEVTPEGIKVVGIREQARRKLEGAYKVGRAKDIPDFYKIITAQRIGKKAQIGLPTRPRVKVPRPIKPPRKPTEPKDIFKIKEPRIKPTAEYPYPKYPKAPYPGAYPKGRYPVTYPSGEYPKPTTPTKYPKGVEYPKLGKPYTPPTKYDTPPPSGYLKDDYDKRITKDGYYDKTTTDDYYRKITTTDTFHRRLYITLPKFPGRKPTRPPKVTFKRPPGRYVPSLFGIERYEKFGEVIGKAPKITPGIGVRLVVKKKYKKKKKKTRKKR